MPHPNNPFYKDARLNDFMYLANEDDKFRKFVFFNRDGTGIIDFKDPDALREYVMLILKIGYNLILPIPRGNLVPRIANRFDYLCWIQSLLLLSNSNGNRNGDIRGIDIGTGATCIYPLLGYRAFGWRFVATELNEDSFKHANEVLKLNNIPSDVIEIRKIHNSHNILLEEGTIKASDDNDGFDFCMCNPPFFTDESEKKPNDRNCEIQSHENCYSGGELTFVSRLIRDSLILKNKIRLYTSMFGKHSTFETLKSNLQSKNMLVASYEFVQADTVRWALAWKPASDTQLMS